MSSKNNFLTIEQTAEHLQVSRQTVAKFIKNKELNASKLNKSYRIEYTDLESFINRGTTVSEVDVKYLKKARNCVLEYSGKKEECDIISDEVNGKLEEISISHPFDFNKYIFGDNLYVLRHILPIYRGKVDLVYIDPPFGTGKNFANIDSDHAYSDTILNSDFLEFLRQRLILIREFLSPRGSIYLHIDKKIGHYVKIIMDEVFGFENFINDITRIKCNPKNFSRNAYGNYTDMILFYAKERDKNIWNEIKEPLSADELKIHFPKKHPKFGYYTTHPIHAPGETLNGDTGQEWQGLKPPKGRHWRYSREELTMLDMNGLIEWSEKGNPRKIVLASEHKGVKIQDMWEFKDKGLSYVSYPTEKNHSLLERIILNSSNTDSLVMDCFAGSGGTLLVASKHKRKWLGIDSSEKSLEVVKQNFKAHNVHANIFKFTSCK